jgi:hypothetical protein
MKVFTSLFFVVFLAGCASQPSTDHPSIMNGPAVINPVKATGLVRIGFQSKNKKLGNRGFVGINTTTTAETAAIIIR